MKITQLKSKFLMNSFDQNTYVVEHRGEYVLIDAGAELEDVEKVLGKKKLSAIFVTHLHFDHIYNIEKIVEKYDADVYVVKGAEEKFKDARKNASVLVRQNMVFNIDESKIKFYEDKISLKKINAKVYFTPGHSSDAVCLLIGDNLFTGDTVFYDFIGRTDLYDSDNQQMVNSLKVISEIDFKTAFPGHDIVADKDTILNVISRIVR